MLLMSLLRWCLRLIGQAKAIAALLNANAKLSTLGGGYFLTRQVGQAIHLARAQAQVMTGRSVLPVAIYKVGSCDPTENQDAIGHT